MVHRLQQAVAGGASEGELRATRLAFEVCGVWGVFCGVCVSCM